MDNCRGCDELVMNTEAGTIEYQCQESRATVDGNTMKVCGKCPLGYYGGMKLNE